MQVIDNIGELRNKLAKLKQLNPESPATVGFVPTMGALHAGHLSLIEKSHAENDFTVVSIFLNPMQFSAEEDLDIYPNTIEEDREKCMSAGADIIFYPSDNEMHPDGFSLYIDMETITDVMCGKSRPHHFRGVLTVVCKLFNIVQPDKAYFGEKDAQQLAIIKRMVIDLNMPIEVIACPTIREADGLAMSTRNTYLSSKERASASCLYKALEYARTIITSKETLLEDIETAKAGITELFDNEPLARIDYIELLDADTFTEISDKTDSVICALAVMIGTTRLIDNMTVHL